MRLTVSVLAIAASIVAAWAVERAPDVSGLASRLARDNADAKAASDAFYTRSERIAARAMHSICVDCLQLRYNRLSPEHRINTADLLAPETTVAVPVSRVRIARVNRLMTLSPALRRVLLAGFIVDM